MFVSVLHFSPSEFYGAIERSEIIAVRHGEGQEPRGQLRMKDKVEREAKNEEELLRSKNEDESSRDQIDKARRKEG